MTTAENQQSIPSQPSAPPTEGTPSQQANTHESLVTNLDGESLATFEALVRLAGRGHADLLDGYLMQRARTPDASTLELLTLMQTCHLEYVTVRTKVAELACLCAAIQADIYELPPQFLPDDLRPAGVSGAPTGVALARLAQNRAYNILAMQARAQQGEDRPESTSEWGGRRDFTRELGFYTVGLIAVWAGGQSTSIQPKKERNVVM